MTLVAPVTPVAPPLPLETSPVTRTIIEGGGDEVGDWRGVASKGVSMVTKEEASMVTKEEASMVSKEEASHRGCPW